MINNFVLLQKLMEKFKLSEPVPAAVREFVLRSRRKNLIHILQKLKIYSSVFGVILFFFFLLKKLGFNVTVFKTILIIALGSLLLTGSISLGIYHLTRESNPSYLSSPANENTVNLNGRANSVAGNSGNGMSAHDKDIVDSALVWPGDFTVRNLKDIEKIKEYSIIKGKLTIKGDSLTSLEGLSGLTSVGSLYIINNLYLSDLRGLENIELLKVAYYSETAENVINARKKEEGKGDYVELSKNTTFYKKTTFVNLRTLYKVDPPGSVHIIDNKNLTTLFGLNNLQRVPGDLILKNNLKLKSLNGINNIESVGGNLEIRYNQELNSLKGLESIKNIKENLKIFKNPKLKDLRYLNNIRDIGNSLHIIYNNSLITLKGLDNLNYIQEDLYVANNPNLLSLKALKGIKILDALNISSNLRLSSLEGLNNLVELKEGLFIKSNNSLKSIDSLSNLEIVRGQISIMYNKKLNQSDAIEFKNNINDFKGRTYIEQNFKGE